MYFEIQKGWFNHWNVVRIDESGNEIWIASFGWKENAEEYLQLIRSKQSDKVESKHKFCLGDVVEKTTGDYYFLGDVRSVFKKRSGLVRYVVENDNGMLFIFNESSLNSKDDAK